MCKEEIKVYTIYKCPICENKYLSMQEAESCLDRCRHSYHKVFQITMTLELGTQTLIGECHITEQEKYLDEKNFNSLINNIKVFWHYDKVDFTAYSVNNDQNTNKETIARMKKYIIAWLETRINFVKGYLEK